MKNKNQIRPQSQYTVNCPKKIQRRILKNLHATAYSRISPERADRARQIIESLNRSPIVQLDTPVVEIQANVIAPVVNSWTSKIKNLVVPALSWLKKLFTPFSRCAVTN